MIGINNRRLSLLAGICIGAIGMILIRHALESIDHANRREAIQECLYMTMLGLQGYSEVHNRLPEPSVYDHQGRPMYSWRFSMQAVFHLPSDPYPDFGAAWNEGPNLPFQAIQILPRVATGPGRSGRWSGMTAITGPGTAWDPAIAKSIDWNTWSDPNTILVVDTAHLPVHWMEPGDFGIARLSQPGTTCREIGLGGVAEGELTVLFADGKVWTVDLNTTCELIRVLCLVHKDDPNVSREALLGPYRIR